MSPFSTTSIVCQHPTAATWSPAPSNASDAQLHRNPMEREKNMKGSQVLNWEFLLFGEGIFGKSMLKTVFRKTPKIAFLIHWYLTPIPKHTVLKLKILKTRGQKKYFLRFHQKTCVFSEQTWGQTNLKHYRFNSVQNIISFKILNNMVICILLDPRNKILTMK